MDYIQKYWKWFFAEGIVLAILGCFALAMPALFTLSTAIIIGWLLIISGVVQGYRTLQSRGERIFSMSFLGSVLSLAVGLIMIIHPLTGVITLTLLLGAFFLVEGVAKVVLSFQIKPAPQWFWILISGLLGILIATIVFSEWPTSAGWFLGILVGVNFLIYGTSMAVIAWNAR